MQIPEQHLAAFRACALLAADKYRKMRDLAERLNEGDTRNLAERQRRAVEALAATGSAGTAEHEALAVNAVTLAIDAANRTIQDLVTRGAINEAAIYESRVREYYLVLTLLNPTEQPAPNENA